VIPGGNVGLLTNDGFIFALKTSGQGYISQIGRTNFLSEQYYPTVAYTPGKWLSVRENRVVINIDFGNGGSPTVTQVANVGQDRIWGNGTILADGRVLVNGGSTVYNQLTGVAYQDTIWDPTTEQWKPGGTAAIPRLYHNSSLLLVSGAVLTAGAGAPGPLVNLNAQIYYPSYLFAPNGTWAARPELAVSPKLAFAGGQINGTVGPNDSIVKVTALRMGASTHSYNSEAAFLELNYKQTGRQLNIQLPVNTWEIIPGLWMIFAGTTTACHRLQRSSESR
jgi:hypothetical protein